MAAFKVSLSIDQGADFSKLVTWKAGTPAVAVNLTGCTAEAQVRATIDSPTVLLSLSTVSNTIVLGGVAGTIEIVVPRALTEGVAWRSGVYDLELTLANGKKRRLLSGAVTISPEITRA